jgi:predicted benzoate:H+ symporter BenE
MSSGSGFWTLGAGFWALVAGLCAMEKENGKEKAIEMEKEKEEGAG